MSCWRRCGRPDALLPFSPCGRRWRASWDASRMRGLYLKENTPHPSSLREDTLSRKGRGFSGRSGALLRAGAARHDSLVQFLIDDVDRVVDLGIGQAELMRDQLYQEVDPFDEG